MIVGHGDIASVLPDRGDLVFFASGVSNSQETREGEYQREKDLLLEQKLSSHIVYFSSIGVLNGESRYYDHKREMEANVKLLFPKFTIIRIGNITWGKNPHTLINFFKNRIKNNEPLEIKDEYRYIVDKDEFLYWINLIPDWNCEISIPGKRMKVRSVIDQYCRI